MIRGAPGWRRVALLCFAGSGIVSGAILVTNREIGHLAIWTITESAARDAFAASVPPPHPASPPPAGDLDRALVAARRVVSLCEHPSTGDPVRWSSIDEMERQIRGGAIADCWPRSLLFQDFARRSGLDTRLWALEGDRFAGEPHTVPEVYVGEWGRWVLLDVTMNVFATDRSGAPLGVLDLRDRVLDAREAPVFHVIVPSIGPRSDAMAAYYAGRVRYAFLRRHAMRDARDRFGILATGSPWLDRLPEGLKKGVAALLGRNGAVLYYHDRHNASLRRTALIAKLWLGLSVLGLVGATLTLAAARRMDA